VICHFFSFGSNRGQPAPVDFYSQGFRLCLDNFPNAAAFTIRAATQIAIHGRSDQPAKYPPKKPYDKKGYQADREQIDQI
jgi:hypothetical protein